MPIVPTGGPQLIARETFQGVGTLTAATPGNLGTVTGNFYKRPGGPLVTGDTSASGYGWSADLQGSTAAEHYAPPSGNPVSGLVCAWYYFGASADNGNANQLASLHRAINPSNSSQDFAYLDIDKNLLLKFFTGYPSEGGVYGTITPTTYQLTRNQWWCLAMAWQKIAGTAYDYYYAAYAMPLGGTWTQIAQFRIYGDPNTQYASGVRNRGNSLVMAARYGAPSLYSIAALADAAIYPGAMPVPAVTRRQWYLNPATGNDGNDGTTATSAWASVAKLNAESANLGMFAGASYATGDTLHIDCSGAPLVVGTAPIQIQTAGLAVLQTGGAIDPLTTLAVGNWTPVGGSNKTFGTTDGGAGDLAAVVPFENGKYLNKVSAANFGTTAATTTANATSYPTTLAALDAAPGSFYCDGTTLYLHPFGDTDPRTDGKTYRRTRNRSRGTGDANASVTYIQAPNVWWDGFVCAGTTLASAQYNDPLGSYCFQWEAGAGGTNLLSHFSVDHYSKHGVGATISGSNGVYTRQDGAYGQSSPYAPGGCTTDVDFSGDATSAGNVANYLRCKEGVNIGVIGSSAGTINPTLGSYTSHASSVAFGQLNMTDCVWAGEVDEQSNIAQVNALRSTFARTGFYCPATFDQCKSTSGMLTTGQGALVLRNCLMVTGAAPGQAYFALLPAAGATISGCTVDLSASTGGGGKAVWGRAASGTAVTIRNVLVLGSAADSRGMLTGFGSADTITMDHNAYATTGAVSMVYNDGTTTADRTLAQWQALGRDAGSFVTGNPMIDANYVPLPGSPLIGAGANIGPLTDFAGLAVFNPRSDIGALQYAVSIILGSGFFGGG